MNGDTSKPEIGLAQTYFAVQTRRQEVRDQIVAAQPRIEVRERIRDANKKLNSAAKRAGVQHYGTFHDAGYRGLYGGFGKSEIEELKKIPAKEDLLDCIGRAELAANEFRITQITLGLGKPCGRQSPNSVARCRRNYPKLHRSNGSRRRGSHFPISGAS